METNQNFTALKGEDTKIIPSTAKPAIVPKQEVQSVITFTNKRPATPLPPLVQAYYTAAENTLQVSAVIFIAQENIEPSSITVGYDNQTGDQPAFYIYYYGPEVETDTFYGFQINFEIKLEKQPELIETFVCDKDPVTSRGTLTTVQP